MQESNILKTVTCIDITVDV